MNTALTRRQLMHVLAAAGLGAAFSRRTVADAIGDAPIPSGAGKVPELQLIPSHTPPRYPALLADGKVIQPQRPLEVVDQTDVLVVGGGAAGFAAAVAAARTGVKTTLVERYGYLGGLWTGGLVLAVICSHAQVNGQLTQVLRGVGGELLDRHTKYDNAITNYAPGKHNPTTDPEATKYLMDEMIGEAGVKMLFHCWVADVVMEGPALRGVVFESKAGRQAILAKCVVDATGDGDVFAAAGAEFEQRLHAIGEVHRLGNADRVDRDKLKAAGVRNLGSAEPVPSTRWVNLRGPSANALDVGDLTRLEIAHRRAIWNHVQKLRKTPGGESLFLLQTAPQLGVRTSRILAGTHQLTYKEARAATSFPDAVGLGGAEGGDHAPWPIPYGVLLPKKLDNLLTAGRSVCADEKLIEQTRLIAPCLTTGHAAGAAAALAVKSNCRPRDIDIPALQKLLRDQGALLA